MIKRCCLLLIIVAFYLPSVIYAQSQTRETMISDLQEVARIATIMVDGDVCQRIMTERALKKLFVTDPQDRWAGSDNFDVNYEPFIQTKKTLIRLARLRPYPIDCNLWMPFKENPRQIQILIRNQYEMSQFWTWGVLHQEIHPEMAAVLTSGKAKTVTGKEDFISVLTPVYNSLGETVGLVEVVSRARMNWQENVK
jgi:hypothetical protein